MTTASTNGSCRACAPPDSLERRGDYSSRVTGTSSPGRVIRFRRLRGAVDKVPTRWFATALVGLFLAGSAAFGGLAEVKPVIPEVEAGDTLSFDQLDLKVERAVLLDALADLYIEPDEEGDRLLGLIVTVTNNWDRTISASTDVRENIRINGVAGLDPDAYPTAVLRFDDSTRDPAFQPGLPAEIVYFFEVPGDSLAKGDDLVVDIYDKSYLGKGFVTAGDYYSGPELAAHVKVVVEDAGDGAADEPEVEEG